MTERLSGEKLNKALIRNVKEWRIKKGYLEDE